MAPSFVLACLLRLVFLLVPGLQGCQDLGWSAQPNLLIFFKKETLLFLEHEFESEKKNVRGLFML